MQPDAPETRHGIDVVPSEYVTSPRHVDAQAGDDVQWWTPSWTEVIRYLGWRWLWFIPPISILLAIVIFFPMFPGMARMSLVLWKPMIIVIMLPATMAIRAVKSIVKNRKDPFCIHCGYTLAGLPDGHRCPECGRQFSLATMAEYRRDPHWFAQRWKTMHSGLPAADVPFDTGPARPGPRRKSRDGT